MKEQRVLYGFHAVTARIRRDAASVLEVYVEAHRRDARMHDFIALAEASAVRVRPVERDRLDGLSGHASHQGVVALASAMALAQDVDDVLDVLDRPPLLLVLDGVTDPHNLGACLRSADAVGVDAVIAPRDRACGLNATVAKVASGAADSVPYIMVTNLARTLDELKERDVRIVGTSDHAEQSLYSAELRGPLAMVLGAEGKGMRRLTTERCDELVHIPMTGVVESLNVSVASAVCLFEAARQRRAA